MPRERRHSAPVKTQDGQRVKQGGERPMNRLPSSASTFQRSVFNCMEQPLKASWSSAGHLRGRRQGGGRDSRRSRRGLRRVPVPWARALREDRGGGRHSAVYVRGAAAVRGRGDCQGLRSAWRGIPWFPVGRSGGQTVPLASGAPPKAPRDRSVGPPGRRFSGKRQYSWTCWQ